MVWKIAAHRYSAGILLSPTDKNNTNIVLFNLPTLFESAFGSYRHSRVSNLSPRTHLIVQCPADATENWVRAGHRNKKAQIKITIIAAMVEAAGAVARRQALGGQIPRPAAV